MAEMPSFDQIMPNSDAPGKLPNPLVVALVYDGLCHFEFACAAEVFGLPRPELEPDWYHFETCSGERVTPTASSAAAVIRTPSARLTTPRWAHIRWNVGPRPRVELLTATAAPR